MDIDEIKWRVDDLESKRADYRKAAEVWERMWMLKVFKQTPEQAQRENKEQVTLPTPYNIVMLAKRLVNTEPRIEVPSGTGENDDDESADKRERWLTAFWQRVTREQRRDILADAVWQVLVRGRFCLEAKWIQPLLPPRLQGSRLPILVRTLDPLQVGVKQGPLWTEYAYHKYREEYRLVKQRYPKIKGLQRPNYYGGDVQDCEVIDFWWTDGKDGAIWNAVIVEGEFAQKPVRTAYPDIPIVEGFGDSAPLSSEEHRGMSILHPIKDIYPYSCRLASQIGTGLLYYFWPAITVTNESGMEVPNLNIAPGTTTQLPRGTQVDVLRPDVNMPLGQAMLGLIDTNVQMSTFPGVMYGSAPGDIQAGYAVSILADQARGRINQFRRNLETALEHVNGIILGLVQEYAGPEGVSIWGKSSGDGRLYQEMLTPADIGGLFENLVTLAPQMPTDEVQKLTLWMRLVESGIVSKRTMRDKAISEILPNDEQLRVDVEGALESEEMKAKKYLRALQDYFPEQWQEIVAGTPLAQSNNAEMQPPPGPGMLPGPTAGMPPQMPPGVPPGMNVPQMPQNAMQVPPGGAMGQPGMPPELANMPPELLAQMMAQMQGGAPPSMPGGPGGGPGLPPSMGPGVQGVPPQVTGGLSPEALGLPPEFDALGLYQQLTGQPLSEEEELDRMMGVPDDLMPPGR